MANASSSNNNNNNSTLEDHGQVEGDVPLQSPTSLHEPPPTLTRAQLAQSTSDLYAAARQPRSSGQGSEPVHVGKYASIRRGLDWSYHAVPNPDRQRLQDAIVDSTLEKVKQDKDWRERHCSKGILLSRQGQGQGQGQDKDKDQDTRPIALFTAGGMGAGKGHTLKQLLKDGQIQLPSDFVWVDPDSLARSLPEREQYIRSDPRTASKKLHPEAALLQELLSGVAKRERRPLVIDGSLSDCGWFGKLMKTYREDGYAVEILFVTAPEEKMLARAERRAKTTGRYTDPEAIKRSRIKSPDCVANLSKPSFVQRVRLVDNSSDQAPATIIYDSILDPSWHPHHHHQQLESQSQSHSEYTYRVPSCQEVMRNEAGVDVKGFVEGSIEQGEDGLVVPVPVPVPVGVRGEQGKGKGTDEGGDGEREGTGTSRGRM